LLWELFLRLNRIREFLLLVKGYQKADVCPFFREPQEGHWLDREGEGDGIVGIGELKIPHNKGARFAFAVQPQC